MSRVVDRLSWGGLPGILPAVLHQSRQTTSQLRHGACVFEVAAAEIRPEDRHFNRWPKLSELTQTSQQKCQEVWMSLGKQGAFPGSQSDFLTLSSATNASDSQKVREILEEAFQLAFRSEKRISTGIGALIPVGSTLPNDWNIFDMHESLTEWTIWAASADSRIIWERLQARGNVEGY